MSGDLRFDQQHWHDMARIEKERVQRRLKLEYQKRRSFFDIDVETVRKADADDNEGSTGGKVRPRAQPQTAADSTGMDSASNQWFAEDPPVDSKFKYGPLEGPSKNIASWMEIGHRTLKKQNGRTSWWIKKVHGKSFAVWFSTQKRYAAANTNRLAAETQNDTK
jgi:hypothetical protein